MASHDVADRRSPAGPDSRSNQSERAESVDLTAKQDGLNGKGRSDDFTSTYIDWKDTKFCPQAHCNLHGINYVQFYPDKTFSI